MLDNEKKSKDDKRMKFEQEISNRIRDLRKEKNISQEELAFLIGGNLEQNQISKIENNSRQISAYDIYRIAQALNVSASYLIDGKGTLTELDKICNYIKIQYENTGYGDTHYSIPIICIDKNLFKFLYNEAQRQVFNTMPDDIKSAWRKKDIADFNKNNLIDSNPLEFVPVTKSTVYPSDLNLVYSHKDLINCINQEFNQAAKKCLE